MFQQLSLFFESIEDLNLVYRIQLKNSQDFSIWDHFLIFPVPDYLECRYGIFSEDQIDQIQIDVVEDRYIGRRVVNQQIDHSELLKMKLEFFGLDFLLENKRIVIQLC